MGKTKKEEKDSLLPSMEGRGTRRRGQDVGGGGKKKGFLSSLFINPRSGRKVDIGGEEKRNLHF